MNYFILKNIEVCRNICWSIKAPLLLYVLEEYGIDSVIYCDSDLFFFSDPNAIFHQWKGYDTLICPQRNDSEFEKVYGQFQSGFLGFRNRKNSIEILKWWKKNCIEWCFNQSDTKMERWADQKYLDQIPTLFHSIKILDDPGIVAAPCNLIINNDFNVYKDNNTVLIDGCELMVYHFDSMEIFNESAIDLWKFDPLIFSKEIIDCIYTPYLNNLNRSMEIIKFSRWVDLIIYLVIKILKMLKIYIGYNMNIFLRWYIIYRRSQHMLAFF